MNPRATEEPRSGIKHGYLKSQSELMESFEKIMIDTFQAMCYG